MDTSSPNLQPAEADGVAPGRLRACREAGALGIEGVDLDMLAHWLSGALNESVFLIAESPNRAQALEQARQVLSVMVSALSKGRRTVG